MGKPRPGRLIDGFFVEPRGRLKGGGVITEVGSRIGTKWATKTGEVRVFGSGSSAGRVKHEIFG